MKVFVNDERRSVRLSQSDALCENVGTLFQCFNGSGEEAGHAMLAKVRDRPTLILLNAQPSHINNDFWKFLKLPSDFNLTLVQD